MVEIRSAATDYSCSSVEFVMGKGLLMLTDAFLYNPHCTNLLTLIFAFFMQNLGQGQFTLVTIPARQRYQLW